MGARRKVKYIEIHSPNNLHDHLREDERLAVAAPVAEQLYDHDLLMGNLAEPITTAKRLIWYRELVLKAAPRLRPLMTFMITPELSQNLDEIDAMVEAGAFAGKFMPRNVSTNSQHGAGTVEEVFPVLERMEKFFRRHGRPRALFHPHKPIAEQERDRLAAVTAMIRDINERGLVPLSYHETPNILSGEAEFIAEADKVIRTFPGLPITMEHVRGWQMVNAVVRWPDHVFATITPHHLYETLDATIGGKLSPHKFMMPVLGSPRDLAALWQIILFRNPKFMLGTDSAPHLICTKVCDQGCAGVFNNPVAMQLLATLFKAAEILPLLDNFASGFAAKNYGLKRSGRKMRFEERPYTVPLEIGGIRPYLAGETLPLSIVSS